MIELTSKQLRRAAEIKDKIGSLQTELNRLLGTQGTGKAGQVKKAGARTMSAAARAKISKAAKARWQKIKAAKK